MSSTSWSEPRLLEISFRPLRFVIPAFYALALLAALIPLTVTDIPLIADYPNHVARMHILGNVDDHAPLAQRYLIDFDLIPNLAMDLAVPWMAGILPLDVASRLFLAITLLSTLASVVFLHRVLFSQWCLSPMLALFFLYHGSFMAGMVNFSLGIGLVPAALGLWILLQPASISWRLLVGSLIALLLYFCHLVALFAYGLLLIAIELGGGREQRLRRKLRELLIAGATALLPMALYSRRFVDNDLSMSADSMVVWGNLSWKAKALLAPLANYNLPLDLATVAIISSLVVWAWWQKLLEIDRRLLPGLVLLAFMFLAAPKAAFGGGVFDQRLAVLLVLVAAASIRFHVSLPAARAGIITVLAGLLLLRLGVITVAWTEHREDLAEMRRGMAMVDPGARILVVRPDRISPYHVAPARHWVFHHAPYMASLPTVMTIEKNAFVSTIYALPGQQPLRLKPPFQELGGKGSVDIPTLADLAEAMDRPAGPSSLQIRTWWKHFDYVVLIFAYGHEAERLRGALPLTPLMDGEILDLFKIEDARDGRPSSGL